MRGVLRDLPSMPSPEAVLLPSQAFLFSWR